MQHDVPRARRRARPAVVLLLASLGMLALGMAAIWPRPGPSLASAAHQSAGQDAPAAPWADVAGPGQAVARPAPQCPRTLACQYAERSLLPDGYRLQSLQVCGANCTTQYWVTAIADGQQLLALDPVRGGAVLAVARASPPDSHPQVRTVVPSYAATDPACCPSAYADTTYTWDAGMGALVAGEPSLTPAAEFPGWEATRQELLAEGWIVGGV